MTDKISVIIPVYNVKKYLDRCLESVLMQSYPISEIIIIDDGSTDGSGEMCDCYAKKYSSIKVYHQKNKGQAAARNLGISKAKSDYIGFVDSDDWIANDMYEYLIMLIKKYKTDCASIMITMTNGEKNATSGTKKEHIDIWCGQDILYNHMLEATRISGAHSVCRCLFRKKAIENIRFPEEIKNEDILYKFDVLARMHKMANSNLVKYFYYQKSESTTRGPFKEKDIDLIKAATSLCEHASKYESKIYDLAQIKLERSYFSILARIAYYGVSPESENMIPGLINKCQKRLRKHIVLLLKSSIPMSRKILIICFCINFSFALKIIRVVKKIRGN